MCCVWRYNQLYIWEREKFPRLEAWGRRARVFRTTSIYIIHTIEIREYLGSIFVDKLGEIVG